MDSVLVEAFWPNPNFMVCKFHAEVQIQTHRDFNTQPLCFSCLRLVIISMSFLKGNSLSAILDGKARLLFLPRDEEYIITMPYAHCKGDGLQSESKFHN